MTPLFFVREGIKTSDRKFKRACLITITVLLLFFSFCSVVYTKELSVLVVDTSGLMIQVDKTYLEYTWESFDTDRFGIKKYVSRNRKTDLLLFQDAGTDVMHTFRFEDVDSIALSPDRGNITPLPGQVDIIDRGGRLYKCKLDYWPLNAPASYLGQSRGTEMIGLKRWLKGWKVDADDVSSFYEIELKLLSTICFLHPTQEDELQDRQRRIKELLQMKDELLYQIKEIDREVDILISE